MKRIVSIVVIIAIIMLSGCDTGESKVTSKLTGHGYEAEAKISDLKTEVPDKAFWASAEKAASLMKKTIERKVNFSIDIRLLCSDGEEIVLQNYNTRLNQINDVWRSIASNSLIYAVATSQEVATAHEDGKLVEVTGVILKWQHVEQHLFSANVDKIISVCDIDNDGTWDYTAEGKMFFTESSTVSLEGENGEKLGIGIDTITMTEATIAPVKDAVTLAEFYSITQN